ncbi:uncharacterized protein TNCV_4953041 [Trichonephila clavipes]|nr:uncharacterized protein TNCV_4953041 [Trichonephila clavipes]
MRDTPIIADHKENLIDSKTKVSQIIADSRVDAKGGQSDQPFHSQGGRQSGSRNSSFRGQNERSRNLNFLSDRCEYGALWDTGAEKSFISEEVYRNYFSYRPRQKTKDRVVTAQGAPCSHLEEKPVDIDLIESKLDDEQQRQLKALFNNFKGLFSDQPGLTHVVYHEIDTGDKGPVV